MQFVRFQLLGYRVRERIIIVHSHACFVIDFNAASNNNRSDVKCETLTTSFQDLSVPTYFQTEDWGLRTVVEEEEEDGCRSLTLWWIWSFGKKSRDRCTLLLQYSGWTQQEDCCCCCCTLCPQPWQHTTRCFLMLRAPAPMLFKDGGCKDLWATMMPWALFSCCCCSISLSSSSSYPLKLILDQDVRIHQQLKIPGSLELLEKATARYYALARSPNHSNNKNNNSNSSNLVGHVGKILIRTNWSQPLGSEFPSTTYKHIFCNLQIHKENPNPWFFNFDDVLILLLLCFQMASFSSSSSCSFLQVFLPYKEEEEEEEGGFVVDNQSINQSINP